MKKENIQRKMKMIQDKIGLIEEQKTEQIRVWRVYRKMLKESI